MATKKKTKKKSTQPKKSKKSAAPKKARVLRSRPTRKSKPAQKTAKNKPVLHKVKAKKKIAAPKKTARDESTGVPQFLPEGRRSRSGEEAGDLQGLSNREGADSESVDELLEEGNAFEADAVSGVEDADNSDEKEVHTHEVPEDDVPEEYLDKD
jgi:N utilization substance protein A